jgi:glycosyltransferase involved in cell wall biosynthesis
MKLLLAASAPVAAIEEKGNADTIRNIHNPNAMFDEVHLLEPYSDRRGVDELGDDIVVHHTWIPYNEGVIGKILRNLFMFVAILQGAYLVRKHDIDVIRGQKPFIGGFVGLFVQWLTGVPSVVSLHNDYDKRQLFSGHYDVLDRKYLTEAIERLVITKSAYTFVLTPYLREYAIRHGANGDDTYVLPNHIDPESFRESASSVDVTETAEVPIDDDEDLVVFVGRLEKQKDPMTLLQGFELAKRQNPDLRLVVVGDGSLRPELEAFVERESLDGVHFTGFVDRSIVAALMDAGDIFALPTLCEGLGFVFIEAHAMNLPVVTTDIPHTNIAVHEDNSLQFEPGDHEGLAERLDEATDEELRADLVDRSRRSLDRLSTDRVHDRVESAFRDICDRPEA